ncbi:hypothetical protein [Amphibacillus sediminis]|uniref:hypothetical protein n=1 Tax=Amphibacillus sediminis TaxID=360185 RepID=UPI001FE087CB|nr:hypothetical protein [Amphibacillus sediminis]
MVILTRLKRKRQGAYTVERKDRTEYRRLEAATVPAELIYPLTMHIGAPATPVVNIGDKVRIGTLIAKQNGLISANIYASVSGEITDIANYPTVNGEAPVS